MRYTRAIVTALRRSNRGASMVFVLAMLVGLAPAADAGIESADPVFEVVPPPPSLRQNAFESDTRIRVIAERTEYELPEAVEVDITQPGVYQLDGDLTNPGTIPAGRDVASYILHSDTDRQSATDLSGTLRFSQKILALIVRYDPMGASDPILGAPGTAYGTMRYDRALETWASHPSDRVELHPDRRTVTVRMQVAGVMDEIRVITDCGEDGVDTLHGTAAEGTVSGLVDRHVEPLAGEHRPLVDEINCTHVVGAEDTVDEHLEGILPS